MAFDPKYNLMDRFTQEIISTFPHPFKWCFTQTVTVIRIPVNAVDSLTIADGLTTRLFSNNPNNITEHRVV